MLNTPSMPNTPSLAHTASPPPQPYLDIDKRLGYAPVRLVDARFLLKLAAILATKPPGARRLPSREELPDACFLTPASLRRLPEIGIGSLRILCVSSPWLTPEYSHSMARTPQLTFRHRFHRSML